MIIFSQLQVLSGVALLSYKVASTPKDEEHPYGLFLSVPTSYSINLSLSIFIVIVIVIIILIELQSQ